MKIISDEQLRIATTSGAAVIFYPGQVKEVSDEIGLMALQEGARSADDTGSVAIKEVTEIADEKPEIVVKSEEDEEFEKLVAIMKKIMKKGDPDDFKADGSPRAAVINKMSGSTITTEQREAAWEEALNSR